MIRFFLHEFSLVQTLFERELESFRISGTGPNKADPLDPHVLPRLAALLSRLGRECKQLELHKAFDRIVRLDSRLEHDICSYQIMMVELEELSNIIASELDETTLAYIPSALADLFERDGDKALFGDDVHQHFKSARAEIRDAGNCLAAGLNTAAVFHLMRVIELGMRALAKQLRVAKARGDVPLELATWEAVIQALEAKTSGRFPRTQKGQRDLDFYKGLLIDFRAFKDFWRNKVMHARIDYDQDTARSAFDHVRAFMRRLATRVTEP